MAPVTPELLARCLDDLAASRSTLDELVFRDPTIAADLRSLVEIAQSIAPPFPVALDGATRSRLRASLIRQMGESQRLERASWSQRLRHALRNANGRLRVAPARIERIPALAAVGVIVLTTTFGGGVVYAAEGTIPGDTLYPVKITVENVQLAFAPNDEARTEILINRANRRLDEISEATLNKRADSARIAADSYAVEVVEATRLLGDAASRGVDVRVVAGRVSANLTRQEDALVAVEQRAPAGEKSALVHADESLKNGLTVAREYAGEAASSARPVETRLATNTASRPGVASLQANTDDPSNSDESNQSDDASRSAADARPTSTPGLAAATQPIVRPTDAAMADESSRKSNGSPDAKDQPRVTENSADPPDSASGQPTRETTQTPRPPTKNATSLPVPRDRDPGHKPPPTPVPTSRPGPKPTPTRDPDGSGHPPPGDDHHEAARTRATSAAPDRR